MLEQKVIDEEVYNYEIGKLIKKKEKQQQNNNSKKLKKYSIILLIAITLLIVVNIPNFLEFISTNKELRNIEAPIQITSYDIFTKNINGIDVLMSSVAKYNIKGRVNGVKRYDIDHEANTEGDVAFDILSPIDVGMCWGFLARNENYKSTSWSMNDRKLY